MHERIRPALLAAVLAAAGAERAAAQVPAGGEFQVNTYTTGAQFSSSASSDEAGRFVVVWLGSQYGDRVAGQRFDAAGIRVGGEFRVDSSSPYLQYGTPRAALAPSGRFVVVWTDLGPPGLRYAWGRGFAADGSPVGSAFHLTPELSVRPAVAMNPAGDFTAVWTGDDGSEGGVVGARFVGSGERLGAEFRVNTFTTGPQGFPSMAADPQGNVVVVCRSVGQDGDSAGVFGQRFDAAGAPRGTEFRVNTYTTGAQQSPAVSVAADGRFVVAWSSAAVAGSGYGIFAQRFDASGLPAGPEFRAATASSYVNTPSVASDAAGNFVVTWTGILLDGSLGEIFGRRFSASGAARGAEFRVNTVTTGFQSGSVVASDATGNVVVTWTSPGQDGSDFGVFAQRFGGLLTAALAVDTLGGNGVFEPGEVVDVVPSWRNVSGAARTIGGTAVSFTGPLPATYQINTPFANYATIPNGATRACLDCYRVAVPTIARPVLHWDAVFDERLTPDAQGQEKPWRVHLGASFTDVAVASPFYRFVETLLHHSVTGGCGATTYCPGSSATREQMAVFVLVAKEGASYRPPACGTPVFLDVPAGSAFCPFIEELSRRGVVSGCGGGNYCPSAAVSREQMPVFVLRTLDPALDPPACTTPVFADVPASSSFCRWIEELARRGVVTGCGGGNYCPADPVTREQMAVFIAGTFGLTLYGP